jgi:acyl-CoA synthetase (AMP-forming)/AMP-acid ligase II
MLNIQGNLYKWQDIKCDVLRFKNLLSNQSYVNLSSKNWIDHLSAYLAWQDVGGVLLVNNPLQPPQYQENVTKIIENKKFSKDSICFLTSGTTAPSRLVIQTEKQINHVKNAALQLPGWQNNDEPVSVIPAFTTGFWHLNLIPSVEKDKTIKIITTDKKPNGLGTVLTASADALVRMKNIHKDLDLTGYNYVESGGSQVLPKHANIAFDSGARGFYVVYGASEISSPTLYRITNRNDEYVDCYDWKPISDNTEIQLVNGELWVKGTGICENKEDFDIENGWLKTSDYWETVTPEMVRFIGRRNDIVKINGFQTNLLHIENQIEKEFDFGEIMLRKNHKLGIDYLELLYTNKSTKFKVEDIKNKLKHTVPACCIPRNLVYSDNVPKTPLGKKCRH